MALSRSPILASIMGWGIYAVFCMHFCPTQFLQAKHRLHHLNPATALDPDFCERSIWRWYLHFMQGYLMGTASPGGNYKQVWILLLGMATIFIGLHQVGQIPFNNLLLFWVLPILLSSVQLFYFGTYLPHHSPGQLEGHRARSSNYTLAWSFLTCYHFGYHWEHHEYPGLPWYNLPSVKRM